MGNLDRLQLLRDFIKEEPENPFNYYALALELREKLPEEASELFEFLLKNHPEYLPVYFTAAHFFAESNEIQKAREIFEKGIQLADSQKEEKALKELKNAFQNFLFEYDLD
ncbi:tetratricopeptide repeat protein [Algoriphagus lacus]|uniref:Tetratricopeptide repeat protein n=1 Tax=Algoriphagus lacus TaxID=2056311 RepID=A0A418PS67_9BACT|nr:tetratricopeptide repeat protein [Algoriphagus lacus]RIW15733.1 tetratricopeptide repeat protein [Algoriphagus lacus]